MPTVSASWRDHHLQFITTKMETAFIVNELNLPLSAQVLRERLLNLRKTRRQRQDKKRLTPIRRRSLTNAERSIVLGKTNGRCHICGGQVCETKWQADHVLAHNSGDVHSVDNYLPAHNLCNNYRWDYDEEKFQWLLKIGVWARKRMEEDSVLGCDILESFYRYGVRRNSRRMKEVPEKRRNRFMNGQRHRRSRLSRLACFRTLTRLSIAYEPIWAIGSLGHHATPQQVQDAHAVLRCRFGQMFGEPSARTLTIQYGGSVKPDNAAALLNRQGMNGALIGGASLDADQFLAIVRAGLSAPHAEGEAA